MSNSLTTFSGIGTGIVTGNPQQSVEPTTVGSGNSSPQNIPVTSSLNTTSSSLNIIPLSGSDVSTIAASQPVENNVTAKHSLNGGYIALVIVLVVAAASLTLYISHTAKNTTK